MIARFINEGYCPNSRFEVRYAIDGIELWWYMAPGSVATEMWQYQRAWGTYLKWWLQGFTG